MNLNSRKTWALLGAVSGLTFVRLLPELPRHSSAVADRRDDIWEGIAWGVGLGWGIIAGMNALIGGSQLLYARRTLAAASQRRAGERAAMSQAPAAAQAPVTPQPNKGGEDDAE